MLIAWLAVALLLGLALLPEDRSLRARHRPGEDGSGDDGGPGRPPNPSQPEGPGGDSPEPPWWPEFERELNAYARQQAIDNTRQVAPPAER